MAAAATMMAGRPENLGLLATPGMWPPQVMMSHPAPMPWGTMPQVVGGPSLGMPGAGMMLQPGYARSASLLSTSQPRQQQGGKGGKAVKAKTGKAVYSNSSGPSAVANAVAVASAGLASLAPSYQAQPAAQTVYTVSPQQVIMSQQAARFNRTYAPENVVPQAVLPGGRRLPGGFMPRRLCTHWASRGWCKRADTCTFAHGMHELHPDARAAAMASFPGGMVPLSLQQQLADEDEAEANGATMESGKFNVDAKPFVPSSGFNVDAAPFIPVAPLAPVAHSPAPAGPFSMAFADPIAPLSAENQGLEEAQAQSLAQALASYEEAPRASVAFLLPGDQELFVGGESLDVLNGAVGRLLLEKAGQPIGYERGADGELLMEKDGPFGIEVAKFDRDRCVYRRLHEQLLRRAQEPENLGKLVVATPEELSEAPLVFAAARCMESSAELQEANGGALAAGADPPVAAFLSVFKEDMRPFGHERNIALLYAALPCKKVPSAQELTKAVFQTMANAVQVVREYNSSYASPGGFPLVETLRVPLMAAEHLEVEAHEAALALLWGLHGGLADTSSLPGASPSIELMPGDAMREAYRLYREKVQPSDWSTTERKFIFQQLQPLLGWQAAPLPEEERPVESGNSAAASTAAVTAPPPQLQRRLVPTPLTSLDETTVSTSFTRPALASPMNVVMRGMPATTTITRMAPPSPGSVASLRLMSTASSVALSGLASPTSPSMPGGVPGAVATTTTRVRRTSVGTLGADGGTLTTVMPAGALQPKRISLSLDGPVLGISTTLLSPTAASSSSKVLFPSSVIRPGQTILPIGSLASSPKALGITPRSSFTFGPASPLGGASPMAAARLQAAEVPYSRNMLLSARTVAQRLEIGPPGLADCAPTPTSAARNFGFKFPQPGYISTVNTRISGGTKAAAQVTVRSAGQARRGSLTTAARSPSPQRLPQSPKSSVTLGSLQPAMFAAPSVLTLSGGGSSSSAAVHVPQQKGAAGYPVPVVSTTNRLSATKAPRSAGGARTVQPR